MATDSTGYRHFSLSPNHAEGQNAPSRNHKCIGCITDKGEGYRKEDMRHTAVQTHKTSYVCPAVILSTHRRFCLHLCVKPFFIMSNMTILEKVTERENSLAHLWYQKFPPDVCNRLWCKFLNNLKE